MTAGAVAAAVVSAPAQSIGTRRRGSRGGATRHARASLSDPGFAADDARWDAAWTSVRDASTRVAFIDGDARRDLRARLTRTNLREALAAIPGEVHLRAEVRTGASEALGDVRAMDLHGGLFGHVDAGATDDGVRRGIETLERDIADVVRSFGKTCGEDSAVVQVSLLRNMANAYRDIGELSNATISEAAQEESYNVRSGQSVFMETSDILNF